MIMILQIMVWLLAFHFDLLKAFQFSIFYPTQQSQKPQARAGLNRIEFPLPVLRKVTFRCQGTANGAHSVKVALEDFPQILRCIDLFQKLYGHKRIPSSFVVPELEDWPTELQGFR